jgi:hypothetical protein
MKTKFSDNAKGNQSVLSPRDLIEWVSLSRSSVIFRALRARQKKKSIEVWDAQLDFVDVMLNRIGAMAVYIRPLFGVNFLRGRFSLKNRS